MFTSENVAHLTQAWQKDPSLAVLTEAKSQVEKFEKLESLGAFTAGLSATALTLEIEYYREYATALFQEALQRGLPMESLMPWHVPVDGLRNHVHSVESAAEIISQSKLENKKTGFLHGHYRLLTPANWANVLTAQENCDVLVLGIEDGWRSREYKGVDPVATNWLRWQWILSSGFDGHLLRISRSDYSDKGYETMLQKLQPDVYFGNFDNPQGVQESMEKRAQRAQVEYQSLPAQSGFHTSEIIEKMSS